MKTQTMRSARIIRCLKKTNKMHVLEDGRLENEDFPGSLSNSCASQAPIPHQPVSSLAVDCTHACYHDEDFELQDSFELHPPQVVAEFHTETEGFLLSKDSSKLPNLIEWVQTQLLQYLDLKTSSLAV
jgi:hypothetical protein